MLTRETDPLAKSAYGDFLFPPDWVETAMVAAITADILPETGFRRNTKKWTKVVNIDVYGWMDAGVLTAYPSGLALLQIRRTYNTKYGLDVDKDYTVIDGKGLAIATTDDLDGFSPRRCKSTHATGADLVEKALRWAKKQA